MNNNNGYNYKENSNYIAAMFNVLFSRFSKARKIKWPSFLQTKEKQYHIIIVCTQWVKITKFVTYKIKEILSFIKAKSAI